MATFTLSHQDLEIQGPLVDVDIWLPQQLRDALSSKGLPIPPPFRVQGLIDTGASSCCITPEVIKALGAIPVGEDPITTASHAAVTAERYALAIRFVAEPTIFYLQSQCTLCP